MKSFTPILTTLASTFIATILANPVDPASLAPRQVNPCGTPVACDACSPTGEPPGIGLQGVFPHASPGPTAACFTSHNLEPQSVGCPCTFNGNTQTSAIVGYAPSGYDGEVITVGHVQVIWTANDGGAPGGTMGVNVYSPWGQGAGGYFPLIGSSPYLAVAGPSSASYPMLTTLPDAMTFTVVATRSNLAGTNPPPLLINFSFTYGTHNHSFPTITSPFAGLSTQQPLADFTIDKPPYPWRYADGLKVPA